MPVFLFSRNRDAPKCPECGGARSATMPLCTTCTMKGKRPGAAAPSQGTPAPSGHTAWPASTPLPATRGAPPTAAPPRSGTIRAKQGVLVASETERVIADFLWDNGLAFGYDQDLGGIRVAFHVPAKDVVLETREDRGRDEALRGRGFFVVLVGTDAREDVKRGLMTRFPGKAWK